MTSGRSFVLLLTAALLQSTQAVGTDRAVITPMVLQGESPGTCPSVEARQSGIESIQNRIERHLAAPHPCGPGLWYRAAYINMSDPQQQCPSGWAEYTSSSIRACGRTFTHSASCSATSFAIDRQYGKVCGRVIGYQVSSTDAFQTATNTIDSHYVDGVSVTHGSPRNHVWTFAGGWSENSDASVNIYNCPCSDSPSTTPPPSFVGTNYYCESANPDFVYRDDFLYSSDKLWDGEQCNNEGTCCTDKSPPWFTVDLLTPTNDDIEVRVCGNEGSGNENTPIELLELYIQ